MLGGRPFSKILISIGEVICQMQLGKSFLKISFFIKENCMGYKYQPNTDRDKIIRKLGYGHYNQYLKSDLWREVIKPKVLAEHDHKCFVCGSKKSLEIHHMDYNTQNLSGKNTNNMVPLCPRCHKHIEFKNGKKVGLEQANSRLTDMVLGKLESNKSCKQKKWKPTGQRAKGWKKRQKDRHKHGVWES